MTTHPEVLAVRKLHNAVELDLHIPPSLTFFPDHFPRFSMLPGVAQIDWAIHLAHEHLGFSGLFRKLAGLKFQHPILPRSDVTLSLKRGKPGELEFAYRNTGRDCSSGRVIFAAPSASAGNIKSSSMTPAAAPRASADDLKSFSMTPAGEIPGGAGV